MKRFSLLLLTLTLVLGMAGASEAITFTDTQWLFRSYSGAGSDSWLHNTPADFSVPPDTLNSATLGIFAWLVDGNNDHIEIEGTAQGTLTIGSIWTLGFSWTVFDIGYIFANWSAGNPLEVNINYDEQGWHGQNFMIIKKSKLTLEYENNSVPTPEPTTILLLGAGLAGLAGFGRKKFFKK